MTTTKDRSVVSESLRRLTATCAFMLAFVCFVSGIVAGGFGHATFGIVLEVVAIGYLAAAAYVLRSNR